MGKSSLITIILVASTLLVSSCEVVSEVLVGDPMSNIINGKSEVWKTVETEAANNKNQKRISKQQEELMENIHVQPVMGRENTPLLKKKNKETQ